jgi:UDP-N-acetylglucosamine 2-epimerase (non-hydrolysing)
MMNLRLACVVGARPNFMKMAPLLNALRAYPGVETVLIHTGQHYDENLSDIFFQQLGMRQPDILLKVGSGKHGWQTARVLDRMEAVLEQTRNQGKPFDRLVVVGDVNSTMAAAVAAAKLGVPVAHIEAGLRSFDRSMPEEINRLVTDAVCDMFFVSEPSGVDNLRREGHPEEQIHLVGNLMIDTLLQFLPEAKRTDVLPRLGLEPASYGVVTLHRPANVDEQTVLGPIVEVLVEISDRLPLVFPIHPRTLQRLKRFGLAEKLRGAPKIHAIPPLGYVEFLGLTSRAKVIVTDSGGLQDETTVLGVPCLTVRSNTERPITMLATSTLVGQSALELRKCLKAVIEGKHHRGPCPALWDGAAACRVAKILVESAGLPPLGNMCDYSSVAIGSSRPSVSA